jgi:hypothetical protein
MCYEVDALFCACESGIDDQVRILSPERGRVSVYLKQGPANTEIGQACAARKGRNRCCGGDTGRKGQFVYQENLYQKRHNRGERRQHCPVAREKGSGGVSRQSLRRKKNRRRETPEGPVPVASRRRSRFLSLALRVRGGSPQQSLADALVYEDPHPASPKGRGEARIRIAA